MIDKIERTREFSNGYGEDKGLESLVRELLDKMDELVDFINENCLAKPQEGIGKKQ